MIILIMIIFFVLGKSTFMTWTLLFFIYVFIIENKRKNSTYLSFYFLEKIF